MDDIIDIIDPSNKAFEHVKRTRRLLDELDIGYKRFYVVGNYRFQEDWEVEVEEKTGEKYLGKIALDESLADKVLKGESLLGLSRNSPAYTSAALIFRKAGY